jgi:hypothetical protein
LQPCRTRASDHNIAGPVLRPANCYAAASCRILHGLTKDVLFSTIFNVMRR